MARQNVLFLAILLTFISLTQAHWYGKRADKADYIGTFLRQRLEAMPSTRLDSDDYLAAIGDILRMWQTQKAQASLEGSLKSRK
ncbi:hypothetical protein LOTGIDRAFT_228752 [Lottia gigantea]|uniref:Uncharacterized protein n=1 Tax=Lottia gigantea TaxID=225164 RepID=V4A3F2_LOTGI|nr:hypothetical protein LOTGIDRAFT_228752 [Lottia gigantea]ESO91262.1 hypothetical protein LOTGIDRAFT_228752 [Lottia gigantea]